jgi:hypothetical protein
MKLEQMTLAAHGYGLTSLQTQNELSCGMLFICILPPPFISQFRLKIWKHDMASIIEREGGGGT